VRATRLSPAVIIKAADHREGDRHPRREKVDTDAFKELVKAAVGQNGLPAKKR